MVVVIRCLRTTTRKRRKRNVSTLTALSSLYLVETETADPVVHVSPSGCMQC